MTLSIRRQRRTCSIMMMIAVVLLSSITAATVWALPITDQFTLSGSVNNPGTFDLADLKAFPQTTQQVTYHSGSGTTSGSFTGVPLYNFLTSSQGGGGLALTSGVKNDFLRDYVVATGSDGYRAIVSVGEIHPNFGRQQDLLAHQFNGQPLGNDGFARLTSPGDSAGGRYVSNLANLQVLSATPASHIAGTGGGISTQFSVSGLVSRPGVYDLAALQALPSITETVTYRAGQSTVSGSFTGVPLWTLLSNAGLITDPTIKNDLLGKYLVATGSDGYKAVIALGEIAPRFGNRNDLVAYSFNGQGLGSDGFARLVLPGDTFGGRYVSNLIGLEVFDGLASVSAPEPATGLLLVIALPGLLLLRSRPSTILCGEAHPNALPGIRGDPSLFGSL